jgi:mono/diheme cytochrome c family protein
MRVIATVGSVVLALGSAAAAAGDVEQGRYLATAANCVTCHTRPGGQPFAGGLEFATPFGKLYSTNITPDPETGIGKWSEEDFARALREGVRPDGAHLYPAFPYTSFTKISDADVAALFRYLRSVAPVSEPARQNELRFPYNQRWALGLWKALYFDEGRYTALSGQSAQWNRGAYLVEGLAHCSACHSPRNFLGAEQSDMAFTGGEYLDKVPGGEVRAWSAPNLTQAANGLKSWEAAQIAAYLKTGKNDHVVTFGPMNEVIMNSTRHLSDEDVNAMAVYLKGLPANEGELGAAASEDVLAAGSTLYDIHCGTCHLPTGMGGEDTGPRLAGGPLVQASNPAALINIILYGPQRPEPPVPVKWKPMEAYADKLSDEEIAALASYMRSAWGNKGGAVAAEQVAQQR